HMPDLNGMDTIRLIREQFKLTPTRQPVILLHSSSDDLAIYDECKKLGVRFNLTKPVKAQELFHYLKNIHQLPTPEVKEKEIIPFNLTVNVPGNKSPVILVAEDVVLNMLLVTTIIKQMIPNVTVIEANSGKEAFDMAIAVNPDLILMDVQMPEVSGIDGTIRIRNHEKSTGKHIPIVALTAGVIKGEKEKCMQAGMDDFLTKPIDKVALHKMLEKHLASFNKQDETSLVNTGTDQDIHHFDKDALLGFLENEQDVFDDLLKEVPGQFTSDIYRLRTALENKNSPEAIKAAHSIRGASLNLFFSTLAKLAEDIELAGAGDLNKINPMFADLVSEWEKVASMIRDATRKDNL
ncbi:MAG: response regulator, partial [Bacteroidota bacterium]